MKWSVLILALFFFKGLSGEESLKNGHIKVTENESTCIYGPPTQSTNFMVKVKSYRPSSNIVKSGSGVIMSSNVVFTALHVVQSHKHIQVIDNKGVTYNANILEMYPKYDFVILVVDGLNSRTPINFIHNTDTLKDNFLTWSLGYIESKLLIDSGHSYPLVSTHEIFRFSSLVLQGMSGGAVVVCEEGEFRLAAVITGYSHNSSFAVNTNLIKQLIREID
jgi:hypothetical protein